MFRRRRWHQKGGTGVPVVAVQLRGDIDIHDIPRRQGAGPGNAVGGFFVQADAGGAGEAVVTLGRRAGPVLRQQLSAQGVELRRGHARRKRGPHGRQGLGHGPAGGAKAVEILCTGHFHGASVRSSRGPVSVFCAGAALEIGSVPGRPSRPQRGSPRCEPRKPPRPRFAPGREAPPAPGSQTSRRA